MSLDGFFAGTNDQVAPFLDRRQNGDTEVTWRGRFQRVAARP